MARLDIEHEKIADGAMTLVHLKGKLDVFTFNELKAFFDGLRKEDKAAKIVVDMSAADYVASSGWSVLLGWRKMLRLGGGSLVLCGLRAETKRVYDVMRIDKLLPACADQAAAVKWLQEEAPPSGEPDA